MLVCSKCGHENDPTWMRCGKCLKPLRSGRDLISGVCPACGYAMMPTEVACLRCAKRAAEQEALGSVPAAAWPDASFPDPSPEPSPGLSLPAVPLSEPVLPPSDPGPMVIDPSKPSAILKNHLLNQQNAGSLPLNQALRVAHYGMIAGMWGCVIASWFLSANGQPIMSLAADAAALAIALTLAPRPNVVEKANAWLGIACVLALLWPLVQGYLGAFGGGGDAGGGDPS